MNVNDLTSLLSCKNYLGFTNANSDGTLSSLITSQSRQFLSQTNRTTFAPTSVSRIFDGNGNDIIMIPDFPLISVDSLVIDGTTIPAAPLTPPTAGAGFYFDTDGRITLVGGQFTRSGGAFGGGPWGGSSGFYFTRARKNVFITYTYGFSPITVNFELQNIPTVAPFNLTPANNFWLSALGVQYFTGGAPLTQVFVAPNAGEFYVNPQTGLYSFNPADAGAAVQLSYTYSGVPEDVQQCVNAMVGYVYGQRGSVGVQTEALGSGVNANRTLKYPGFIMDTIYYYRRRYRGPSS